MKYLVRVANPGDVVEEAFAGVPVEAVKEGDAVNFFDKAHAIEVLGGGYTTAEDAEFVRQRAEEEYILLYGSKEGQTWSVVTTP